MHISREFFEQGTNHAPDPGFESGAVLHSYRSVATGAVDASRVVSSPVISGDYSLYVGVTTGPVATGVVTSLGWTLPVAPLSPWSVSVRTAYASANYRALMTLRFLDFGGAVLVSHDAIGVTGQAAPQLLAVANRIAPADAASLRLELRADMTVTGLAGGVYYDELVIVNGAAVREFFSGDSGNANWVGARMNSASERAGEAEEFAIIRTWVPPFFFEEPVT